jgi:hypothetical protein
MPNPLTRALEALQDHVSGQMATMSAGVLAVNGIMLSNEAIDELRGILEEFVHHSIEIKSKMIEEIEHPKSWKDATGL